MGRPGVGGRLRAAGARAARATATRRPPACFRSPLAHTAVARPHGDAHGDSLVPPLDVSQWPPLAVLRAPRRRVPAALPAARGLSRAAAGARSRGAPRTIDAARHLSPP